MPTTTTATVIKVATGAFIGFALGLPTGALIATPYNVTVPAGPDLNPYHHHGVPEDDPSFSCVDDGNRVCGPNNANQVPAGCYDDGGVLFAPWPCRAWTPADGHRHADGTVTK